MDSGINKCVFYRDITLFVVYVNDGIVADKDMNRIYKLICKLNEARYNIEDKSTIKDCLGVNFKYNKDNNLELTQPQLI